MRDLERRALPAPVVDQARALLIVSRRGVARILTSALLVETRVLLGILVCKSLLQKFIPLQGFLPRSGAEL
jgi:hypothetical protein